MGVIQRILEGSTAYRERRNDTRPVKFIQEKENVWRVVYAD